MSMDPLKPGDVVTYGAEDCVVERQTTYRSPSGDWVEWELNPGSVDRRIVLVGIGEVLYEARALSVEGKAGDESVRGEGSPFRLGRHGKADVSEVGASGAAAFDRVEFWHYLGDGGKLIAISRRHGMERALLLQPTTPAALETYGPGGVQ